MVVQEAETGIGRTRLKNQTKQTQALTINGCETYRDVQTRSACVIVNPQQFHLTPKVLQWRLASLTPSLTRIML